MTLILIHLLIVLFIHGHCDQPPTAETQSHLVEACPELPVYSLRFTDELGKVVEIDQATYMLNDTVTISSHSVLDFVFQANSRSEFRKIEFSVPGSHAIHSRIQCTMPDHINSVVFNTGNPFLTGRRYSQSANPADPVGTKKITIAGELKTGTSGAHFTFLIRLEGGLGPAGETCEFFHQWHFITE